MSSRRPRRCSRRRIRAAAVPIRLELMRNLTEVEQQIQFARRYYNGAVNNLNTRTSTFPDLLVARLLRFGPAEYFEFEP